MAGSPQPSRPLVQQLPKWFGQFSNLWGELAHLVDHALKELKLCGVGRCLHVGDSFDLVRVCGDAVCTDDVTKEIEGILAKFPLLLVKGDTGCLESLDGGKKCVPAGSSHG